MIPIPQFHQKTNTTLGIEMNYEAINMVDIVTDDDGSLKIKQVEEFIDSKTFLDSMEAMQAAQAK